MYWVYMVRCADHSLYTGITTDINRRIQQHNGVLPGGARYTQSRRPVSLVYRQVFPDRSSASKQEYLLKSFTKAQKENYLQNR